MDSGFPLFRSGEPGSVPSVAGRCHPHSVQALLWLVAAWWLLLAGLPASAIVPPSCEPLAPRSEAACPEPEAVQVTVIVRLRIAVAVAVEGGLWFGGTDAVAIARYALVVPPQTTTFPHDGTGNRTSKSVNGALAVNYHFDSLNRLVQAAIVGSGSHWYAYDYRTRRIWRRDNGQTAAEAAVLTYSGGTSVQEFAVGTAPTFSATTAVPRAVFMRGSDLGGGVGGLLYSRRKNGGAWQSSFNSYNARGDVIAQFNNSQGSTFSTMYRGDGNRVNGTTSGSNPDRQRANTKEEDPTGLLNEGFRYRDLETGVFLTRDLAGFIDGPNLYTYVRQNSWTAWDPHGLNLVTMLFKRGINVISHDADGVARIAGRRATSYMPRGVNPGDTHFWKGDLGRRYPNGVRFNEEGFPDFSPYRQKPDVKIDNLAGDTRKDFKAADAAAGIDESYRIENRLTWHHHQDGETMQLIPSEINDGKNTPHIGGAAIIRSARSIAEEKGLVSSAFGLVAGHTQETWSDPNAPTSRKVIAPVADVVEFFDPGIGAASDAARHIQKYDWIDSVSNFLMTGEWKSPTKYKNNEEGED